METRSFVTTSSYPSGPVLATCPSANWIVPAGPVPVNGSTDGGSGATERAMNADSIFATASAWSLPGDTRMRVSGVTTNPGPLPSSTVTGIGMIACGRFATDAAEAEA